MGLNNAGIPYWTMNTGITMFGATVKSISQSNPYYKANTAWYGLNRWNWEKRIPVSNLLALSNASFLNVAQSSLFKSKAQGKKAISNEEKKETDTINF